MLLAKIRTDELFLGCLCFKAGRHICWPNDTSAKGAANQSLKAPRVQRVSATAPSRKATTGWTVAPHKDGEGPLNQAAAFGIKGILRSVVASCVALSFDARTHRQSMNQSYYSPKERAS